MGSHLSFKRTVLIVWISLWNPRKETFLCPRYCDLPSIINVVVYFGIQNKVHPIIDAIFHTRIRQNSSEVKTFKLVTFLKVRGQFLLPSDREVSLGLLICNIENLRKNLGTYSMIRSGEGRYGASMNLPRKVDFHENVKKAVTFFCTFPWYSA